MGTSAGRNGRWAAVAAAGRPTCDDIYRAVAEDFLRRMPALDHDEDFAIGVARHFREAPVRVCCREIGAWIDGKLSDFGWSQQGLADRVGVDRSAVARWTAGGSISLGHLVLVLIEFRSTFAELPVPVLRELALEGYLAALAHVRAKLDQVRETGPIDRERFWCLYHLFSEPNWEQAVRKGSRELLEKESDRILRKTAETVGHPPRMIAGVADLKRLVEQWGAAWVICLNLVPRDWSIR
jgi:hypothetical protein